jgi:hypothetical protein
VQVGARADSGINGMCVVGNYCYLAAQCGLYVDDVSNPASPHRVAAIGGFEALAVTVRDTLCFVGTYTSDFALRVYRDRAPAARAGQRAVSAEHCGEVVERAEPVPG